MIVLALVATFVVRCRSFFVVVVFFFFFFENLPLLLKSRRFLLCGVYFRHNRRLT